MLCLLNASGGYDCQSEREGGRVRERESGKKGVCEGQRESACEIERVIVCVSEKLSDIFEEIDLHGDVVVAISEAHHGCHVVRAEHL